MAHYAHLVLAPMGGWGTLKTLLGANKYSCILVTHLFIPIHTYIHTTDHVTPQYVATNLEFFVKNTLDRNG